MTATRTEERERFGVLTDAMPLIAVEKREALMNADVSKAILRGCRG